MGGIGDLLAASLSSWRWRNYRICQNVTVMAEDLHPQPSGKMMIRTGKQLLCQIRTLARRGLSTDSGFLSPVAKNRISP